MNNQKHFIKTSDEATSKQLAKEGLNFIGMEGKYFVHLNDWSKKNFSEFIDQKKILYSSRISI